MSHEEQPSPLSSGDGITDTISRVIDDVLAAKDVKTSLQVDRNDSNDSSSGGGNGGDDNPIMAALLQPLSPPPPPSPPPAPREQKEMRSRSPPISASDLTQQLEFVDALSMSHEEQPSPLSSGDGITDTNSRVIDDVLAAT
jgi:hypothetical protein